MPYLCYYLESCRQRYERGERAALLEALDFWLASCIGPPEWIAKGFAGAWAEWLCGSDLNAAFGVRQPERKHSAAQRKRTILGPRITIQIEALKQQKNVKRDLRAIFERVGKDIGEAPSYVREVHYDKAFASLRRMLERMRVTYTRR
jgi:hypothetical protein